MHPGPALEVVEGMSGTPPTGPEEGLRPGLRVGVSAELGLKKQTHQARPKHRVDA